MGGFVAVLYAITCVVSVALSLLGLSAGGWGGLLLFFCGPPALIAGLGCWAAWAGSSVGVFLSSLVLTVFAVGLASVVEDAYPLYYCLAPLAGFVSLGGTSSSRKASSGANHEPCEPGRKNWLTTPVAQFSEQMNAAFAPIGRDIAAVWEKLARLLRRFRFILAGTLAICCLAGLWAYTHGFTRSFADAPAINNDPAVLNGKTVSECTLSGLVLKNVTIRGAVFTNVQFADLELTNVVFESCAFLQTELTDGRFENVVFRDCRLGLAEIPHSESEFWHFRQPCSLRFEGVTFGQRIVFTDITGGSLVLNNCRRTAPEKGQSLTLFRGRDLAVRVTASELPGDFIEGGDSSQMYATDSRFEDTRLLGLEALYVENSGLYDCHLACRRAVIKDSEVGAGFSDLETAWLQDNTFAATRGWLPNWDTTTVNLLFFSQKNKDSAVFIKGRGEDLMLQTFCGRYYVENVRVNKALLKCQPEKLDDPGLSLHMRNASLSGAWMLENYLFGGSFEDVEFLPDITVAPDSVPPKEAAPPVFFNVRFPQGVPWRADLTKGARLEHGPLPWPDVPAPGARELAPRAFALGAVSK